MAAASTRSAPTAARPRTFVPFISTSSKYFRILASADLRLAATYWRVRSQLCECGLNDRFTKMNAFACVTAPLREASFAPDSNRPGLGRLAFRTSWSLDAVGDCRGARQATSIARRACAASSLSALVLIGVWTAQHVPHRARHGSTTAASVTQLATALGIAGLVACTGWIGAVRRNWLQRQPRRQ